MHIVLVEPSRVGIRIMTDMLGGWGDKVTAFSDGSEAYSFITANPDVDVVVTSFEAGTMSGLELCWQTRLLADSGRFVYSIAMSSSAEDGKLTEALDAGADEFIRKPPNKTELQARLRSAARYLNSQRELLRLAHTDPLTGLLNRRAFIERGETSCSSHAGRPLSVICLDIDHFKSVNDRYGHDVGDIAIRSVADCIAEADGAICGRLGGEEYALVLAGIDRQAAEAIASGLRQTVEAKPIRTGGAPLLITCSFGVATSSGSHDLALLLKQGDIALYEAKNAGRNRVVAFEGALKAA